jgi:hypothetical protein
LDGVTRTSRVVAKSNPSCVPPSTSATVVLSR